MFGEGGGGRGEHVSAVVGAEVGGCGIGVGAIDDGGGVGEGYGGDGAVEGRGEVISGEFAGTVETCGECVDEVVFVLGSEGVCEGTEVGVVGQGDAISLAAVEAVGNAKFIEGGVLGCGEAGTEGAG